MRYDIDTNIRDNREVPEVLEEQGFQVFHAEDYIGLSWKGSKSLRYTELRMLEQMGLAKRLHKEIHMTETAGDPKQKRFRSADSALAHDLGIDGDLASKFVPANIPDDTRKLAYIAWWNRSLKGIDTDRITAATTLVTSRLEALGWEAPRSKILARLITESSSRSAGGEPGDDDEDDEDQGVEVIDDEGDDTE